MAEYRAYSQAGSSESARERSRRSGTSSPAFSDRSDLSNMREGKFGKRENWAAKGVWGRKTPSIASLESGMSKLSEEGFHAGVVRDNADREHFKMTVIHSKLLILVSKYAQASTGTDVKETWIRELPLLVLVYEGIVSGVFEIDYSPQSVTISHSGVTRRQFLNISQEAKSCIDELREHKLLNGLKIATEDFQPITAYQVSTSGIKYLKTLPNTLFQDVDSFTYAPNAPHYDSELLHCSYDGDAFLLTTRSGYQRQSSCSDVEDVSYVTSPFLPANLRTPWGKPLSSNTHRAHECALGVTDVKDELNEALRLSNVTILVGEWVPYGANNIVALNERLGALDRCQGGFFTALVDKTPLNTNFKISPGLTSVKVIDFDLVHFINIETEINFPEATGIVQVEHFGMHLNMDGTVLNGMKIEAVMDRAASNVSIDLLARILVDIQLDSSKIMDDLLSGYQRSLMDMMFIGDSANRNKVNVIVADMIHPKLPAAHYLDRGFLENELKQVVGEIYAAEDVSDENIVIIGKIGIMLCGPDAMILEPFLLYYTSLLCREAFVRNFFLRTFILNDTLNKIRQLTLQYHTDPDNVGRLRTALSEASRDLILMEETLSYLAESMQDLLVPELPQDSKGQRLLEILNCKGMSHNVTSRIEDMTKLISGAANQLKILQRSMDIITTRQLENIFRNIDSNTKFLVDASTANERSSASLSVMQVVLAGGFCFMVVDRLAAGTLNINQPAWVYTIFYEPLIVPPGVWFAFNMIWLFASSYGLIRLMRFLEFSASGALTLRVKLNKKFKSVEGLHTFFSDKIVDFTDTDVESTVTLREVEWEEDADDDNELKWLGCAPSIELQYDAVNQFILRVVFSVDRKSSFATEEDLVKILLQDLVMAGAMDREAAFGPDIEEGEIEHALELARLGHSTEKKQKKAGIFGFFSQT